MFSSRFALAAFLAVFMVVGCGGPQSGPNLAGTIPSAKLGPLVYHPKCHGDGHVRVKPCPITLDSVTGIEVDVTGPPYEKLTKAWVFRSCGAICVTHRVDLFHFQVTPGTECGTQKMEFRAYTTGNQIAGVADLTVTNNVC